MEPHPQTESKTETRELETDTGAKQTYTYD